MRPAAISTRRPRPAPPGPDVGSYNLRSGTVTKQNAWVCVGLAGVLVAAGCGGGDGDKKPAAPAASGAAADKGGEAAKTPEVSGPAGSIKGKVTFTGEPPKLKAIDMAKDPKCVAAHKDPVLEESLLAGDGNTLGNVVVEVKRGPKTWRTAAAAAPVPTTKVVMDQKGCMYVPHVFAIRAGTPFEVKNSDDTDHNVHFYGEANKTGSKDNVAQPKGAPNITWNLAVAEENPALFKCDVHPWMNAYGRILDHGSFVVTAKDGMFELKDLPPGEYTVQAWHEMHEKPVSKKVTVEPGKPADWNPVFKF